MSTEKETADMQDTTAENAEKEKKEKAETKRKQPKKRRRPIRALLTGLDRLPEKVRESLPVKALCFLGCLDERARRKAPGSMFAHGASRMQKWLVAPTKRRFAANVENSRVLDLIFRMLNFMYTLPIIYYGIMLFMAGLTMCGMAAITLFIQGTNITLSFDILELPMMIPGIVLIFLSLPFLFAENHPLSTVVVKSRFGQSILCGFLGLDPVSIRRNNADRQHGGFISMLSLLIGVGSAVIVRFVNPYLIPMTVFIVLLITVVMTAPEAGLMLLCVFLPLLTPYQLCSLAFLVVFSFMVKLLRGKRSLRLTTADWAMLILALLIFTNCVINRSDIGYACMAILFCLVAVTGSHLLRSHGVAFRFQRSLMISSLITVLAVMADVAISYVPKWVLRDIPVSVFSDRVLNNFGTRDHAGLYLFLIFPFVMSAFYLSKKMRAKFCYFMYALLIFGCFVLTESRTVMIIGVLLVAMYLLLRNPRHLLTILFFGALGVLAFVFLLPRNYAQIFINYFSDSGNRIMEGFSEFKHIFSDSATRYYTGLGFGQVQGSNFYTMALSSLGIIGFLTLVLAMLLLIGYATVSTIRNRSASPRLQPIMSACYTAVLGVLCIGARLPVFNSAGVLLMFCLIYGFTLGIGRTMRKSAVLLEAATDHDIEFSPIFMQGGDLSE